MAAGKIKRLRSRFVFMKALWVCFACALYADFCFAQDSIPFQPNGRQIYRVETVDGIKFTGILIYEEEDWMQFQTRSLGEVSVLKSKIKALRRLSPEDLRNGEYWCPDPAYLHYMLSPTALPTKKGEGSYNNFYLAIHGFDVGVSEHLSFGGGGELLSPLLDRSKPELFYLNGKYCFTAGPKISLAGGAMYLNSGFSLGDAEGSSNVLGFALATFGSRDNNVTLGAGWGYRSTSFEDPFSWKMRTDSRFLRKPVLTFSAISRIGKHFSLMTENWIFPVRDETVSYYYHNVKLAYEYYFVFTYGVRFFTERFSADAGLLNNSDIIHSFPTGIPYIGMRVKLGGRRQVDDRDWEFPGKH